MGTEFPSSKPEFKTGIKLAGGNSIITPVFRCSFTYLVNPQMPGPDNDLKEPKYSVLCLFPPDADFTLMNGLLKDILENGRCKFGTDPSKHPHGFKNPWHDQGEKEFDGFVKGSKYITISSAQKPDILAADGVSRITDTSMIYSGCFARAIINAFDYSNKSKGVSFGLNHIQKIADGPSLGNRVRSEGAFSAVEPQAGFGPAGGTGAPSNANALFG